MNRLNKLWIDIRIFFWDTAFQKSNDAYIRISNLDKFSFDIAIKDFLSMTKYDNTITNLFDIFVNKKKSNKSQIKFIINNPFSGFTVPVILTSISKSNKRSYSSFYVANLYKKDASKLFNIFINDKDINNGYVFFKNEYLTFKTILYHELAHSTLESLRNETDLFHERVADIVSLIKVLKDEDFNLIEFKHFLKSLIMFRAYSYSYNSYYTNKAFLDCHYTINYLLGVYQLSEDNLNYLKAIPDLDLVTYVELLVKALSPLSDNPLMIMPDDLHHCDKYLDPYVDSISFDINNYFNHEKRSMKFYKKFKCNIPFSLKECLRKRFLSNISTNVNTLTSFLLTHMVKDDFNTVVNCHFNQDDFNYVFEDSKVLYTKYLKRIK